MEFGAGKGFLGLALAEAAPGAALVLVDRGAFRLGADRCAGFANRMLTLLTLFTLIRHAPLENIPEVATTSV